MCRSGPRPRGNSVTKKEIGASSPPSNNADIALRRSSSIGITVTTVNPTPLGNAAASVVVAAGDEQAIAHCGTASEHCRLDARDGGPSAARPPEGPCGAVEPLVLRTNSSGRRWLSNGPYAAVMERAGDLFSRTM